MSTDSSSSTWSFNYRTIANASTTLLFLWNTYLTLRQRDSYSTTTIPAAFTTLPSVISNSQHNQNNNNDAANNNNNHNNNKLEMLTQAKFEETQRYGRKKCTFSLICSTFDFALTMLSRHFDVGPKVWSWSLEAVCPRIQPVANLFSKIPFIGGGGSEIANINNNKIQEGSLWHVFADQLVGGAISTVVALPQKIYFTFVLEEEFGFNKTSCATFIKDTLKSFVLTTCVLAPLQNVIVDRSVRKFQGNFPLVLFGGVSALILGAVIAMPTLIFPLFNKFEPLPDGSLKTKIDALATKLNFPVSAISVMDGSRHSHHSNAYMIGPPLCPQRIVIYDTLIEQLNDEDEVVAVLAHEIGHWFHLDSLRMLALNEFLVAGICAGLRMCAFDEKLYKDFGYQVNNNNQIKNENNNENVVVHSPVIGLELFSQVFMTLLMEVVGVVAVAGLSRPAEYRADQFAIAQGFGPKLYTALLTMQKENLGCVTPDPVYESLRFSHPSMVARLGAIEAAEVQRQ